jgi:uncharacterized protein
MAKHFNKIFVVLTVTSLLVSCAAPVSKHGAQVEQRTQISQKADTQQDLISSAEHYLQLGAKATPPQSYEYHLLASEMYLRAGELQQAQHWLDEVPTGGLATRLKTHKKILSANIALKNSKPTVAIDKLQSVSELSRLSKSHRKQILDIRANAYQQIGYPLNAAMARSELDTLLIEPEMRKQNRDALWQALGDVEPEVLKRESQKNYDSLFSGWVNLALLLRTQDVTYIEQSLYGWQQAFPRHPAQDYIPGVSRTQQRAANMPKQIALLLPLSGTHQKAAEAIRDGFLTRYYENDNHFASKPTVKIYDTTAVEDIRGIYHQAEREGADFVIGPLMKQNVLEMSKLSRVSTPILALNQNQAIKRAPSQFFQFALAPEDEAEQIAQKAAALNYKNAAIVVPNNNWGERIIQAFTHRWQGLGGHLVKAVKISSNEDQAKAIRRLFNIDDSQERSNKIKFSIREKVNFQPRRREDVDVIMMAAAPEQARQIKPLLNFYFAQDIPVLATSSVYAGSPTPSKDQDMNGIIFCDMPWLLLKDKESYKTRALIQHHWPQEANMYARLFAMGVDAYDLSSQLDNLKAFPHQPYKGATGYLSLGADSRIDRQLVWAKFEKGLPSVIN